MALKVIGAGGPRTGTASLKTAFETLGFGQCQHLGATRGSRGVLYHFCPALSVGRARAQGLVLHGHRLLVKAQALLHIVTEKTLPR